LIKISSGSMAQHQQLDVFGALAAPTPDQRPQQSREGEIGEGERGTCADALIAREGQ
jgi:hypothetical protein